MKKYLTNILVSLVLVTAFGAGLWLSIQSNDNVEHLDEVVPGLTLLRPPRKLAAFELSDHRGEIFNLDRLRGKWTLVFFGFTHCPDVCPTTLQVLADAWTEVVKEKKLTGHIQVLFVSVDGERDTQEKLGQYIEFFHKDFIAARGQATAVDALSKQVSAAYELVKKDPSARDYNVNHTAHVFLIDPEAQYRGLLHAPHQRKTFSSLFRRLK